MRYSELLPHYSGSYFLLVFEGLQMFRLLTSNILFWQLFLVICCCLENAIYHSYMTNLNVDVKNFDIRNYKSEKNELLLNSRRYSILVKCIILSSERPLLWNQLLKVVLYVFQINNIHLSPKDFNPSRPGHFWKLYWNKKLSLIFIFTLLCGVSEGFEVPLRCAFEVP